MEEYLGRPLPDGCEVHHRNQDRSDNRIENLLLMRSKQDHWAIHRAMDSGNLKLIEAFENWSRDFMERLRSGLPIEECYKAQAPPAAQRKSSNITSIPELGLERLTLYLP